MYDDPTRFKLTLEDGTVYVFDKYLGLLSITDPGVSASWGRGGRGHRMTRISRKIVQAERAGAWLASPLNSKEFAGEMPG